MEYANHYAGYVYPNESVEWGLMIVMYPYITGIVAGAFIVSSLYHVFKNETLAPVGKLALLVSLAFLCFATTPLLLHLGHPERSFSIMIRPNLLSAMSGFGFIYSFYMALLLLEIWFIYRPVIVDCGAWPTGHCNTRPSSSNSNCFKVRPPRTASLAVIAGLLSSTWSSAARCTLSSEP